MYFVCFTCSLYAPCTSSNNWKFWSLFRIISHLLYLSHNTLLTIFSNSVQQILNMTMWCDIAVPVVRVLTSRPGSVRRSLWCCNIKGGELKECFTLKADYMGLSTSEHFLPGVDRSSNVFVDLKIIWLDSSQKYLTLEDGENWFSLEC